MKLEIGKEYKTRNGLKVKVYDIANSGKYPVITGVITGDAIEAISYTIDGVYDTTKSSDNDIVGEWKEPLDFDWECLPAWCNKYIAMDRNGVWYAYSDKPILTHIAKHWYFIAKHWYFKDEYCEISNEYTPKNFKKTWEESLFKNPNLPCE